MLSSTRAYERTRGTDHLLLRRLVTPPALIISVSMSCRSSRDRHYVWLTDLIYRPLPTTRSFILKTGSSALSLFSQSQRRFEADSSILALLYRPLPHRPRPRSLAQPRWGAKLPWAPAEARVSRCLRSRPADCPRSQVRLPQLALVGTGLLRN